MGYLGFILFLIGAGGVDSENMIIPAVMVLVGLGLIALNYLKEKSFAQHRGK